VDKKKKKKDQWKLHRISQNCNSSNIYWTLLQTNILKKNLCFALKQTQLKWTININFASGFSKRV
jgi:hypothetical protein